tara:strand:+ start:7297 stop:7857 length:561 start_codon:yes stop_codon:yes gene_type:complete
VEATEILKEAGLKMDHSVESLRTELASVRAGRANPALLENIQIEAYGTHTPINQVATISTPDARTISIQPWDPQLTSEIVQAIQTSDLGLTPTSDGTVVHLPVPPLTEERRLEYVKLIKKLGEDGKIGIRNIRREMNDRVKTEEKEHRISEDESKRFQKTIQEITDQHTTSIETAISAKEQEILEI